MVPAGAGDPRRRRPAQSGDPGAALRRRLRVRGGERQGRGQRRPAPRAHQGPGPGCSRDHRAGRGCLRCLCAPGGLAWFTPRGGCGVRQRAGRRLAERGPLPGPPRNLAVRDRLPLRRAGALRGRRSRPAGPADRGRPEVQDHRLAAQVPVRGADGRGPPPGHPGVAAQRHGRALDQARRPPVRGGPGPGPGDPGKPADRPAGGAAPRHAGVLRRGRAIARDAGRRRRPRPGAGQPGPRFLPGRPGRGGPGGGVRQPGRPGVHRGLPGAPAVRAGRRRGHRAGPGRGVRARRAGGRRLRRAGETGRGHRRCPPGR